MSDSIEEITAPDGASATFDRERTAAAYVEMEAELCPCVDCRNYEAAWKPELMFPEVLRACETLGIDPRKVHEVTPVFFDPKTRLLCYHGHFPFFGTVTDPVSHEFAAWSLASFTFGTFRIAEDAVQLSFFVDLPWVLSEPNPNAVEESERDLNAP